MCLKGNLGKAGKLVYQKKECGHLVVTTSVKQEHGCDWPYQQFWAPLCVKGVACVKTWLHRYIYAGCKPTIEGVYYVYDWDSSPSNLDYNLGVVQKVGDNSKPNFLLLGYGIGLRL